MASPAGQGQARAFDNEIDLKTAVSQTFALKSPSRPKSVGQYGRMMWTAVDERKVFLSEEDASEFHQELIRLQVQPAEFIRVTRVKHGSARGGGFSIRVERVEDNPDDPPSRLESQLAASIPLARQHGAAAFHAAPETREPQRETRRAANSPERTAPVQESTPKVQFHATPAPPATRDGRMSALLAEALIAAVNAFAIAQQYANAHGLPDLVFGAEDIRTSANTMLIQYWRDGGTR
jgi:hypothetical protein